MFGHKKAEHKTYDKENEEPVLRCSICTGEQVAGFLDLHSGKFTEITLIRDEQDLERFKETYGISTIRKIY
ncbi:MAG: aspartate dehydrogenase [Lachnospiraceae bacterium]|nr:aspartate dehydrogenase [Lachnospiraceae bacterium]